MLRSAFRPVVSLSRTCRGEPCAPSTVLLRRLSTPTSTLPATQTTDQTTIADLGTSQTQQAAATTDGTGAEAAAAAAVAAARQSSEGFGSQASTADTKEAARGRAGDAKLFTANRKPAYAHLGSLPGDCTLVDVVKAMMAAGPTGRILSMRMTPPGRQDGVGHPLYAQVSIEFNSFPAAARLLQLRQEGKFYVKGVKPFIKLQMKTGPPDAGLDYGPRGQPFDETKVRVPPSRVLLIKGRIDDPRVQVDALGEYFKGKRISPETENVEVRDYEQTGTRVVIWRFCSWRYQARPALRALRTDFGQKQDKNQGEPLGIYYGYDPCEIYSSSQAKEGMSFRSIRVT